MKRREFLKAASVTGVSTGLAAPAIAQSMPEIRWRVTSGFPRSLDTVFSAAETLSRLVAEATDGKFQIQPFAAGELVGTFQAVDAVSNGTVEVAHTASYYYVGKDPTFSLGTAIPFGMNARQTNAWMYYGGGNELLNEFYAKHNILALPGGNTGTQMGGWFRKELKQVDDVRGLKFRISGLAGQVLSKIGAVPQQIPGADIYPALERGTIDAAEWVGPYDDEKLGFVKVAPYYYYPGFWEGESLLHFFINRDKWNDLPTRYKLIFQTASMAANLDVQARYDARNPAALRRLVSAGAQLRSFPVEIMDAALQAAQEIYNDLSSRNADWKKIYDSYKAFRADQYLWWQVGELTYDHFMVRSRARL